jgi:Transposase, Mutator family
MAAGPSIDVSGWLEEQLAQASPDLLRAMVTTFAEALMGAEADAVCGAPFGERSTERTNTRNGYRRRDWDTRAGSISLAIPKLRQGSYFPDWLLERRRRAEAAVLALGGLTFGCIEGGSRGFGAAPVMAAFTVAVLAFGTFLAVQAHSSHPMVPLALFRSRPVAITLAVAFITMAGF